MLDTDATDTAFTYYSKAALDVLTGLAAKLISNLTNALAHTRLDRGMDKYAWVHPDDR